MHPKRGITQLDKLASVERRGIPVLAGFVHDLKPTQKTDGLQSKTESEVGATGKCGINLPAVTEF